MPQATLQKRAYLAKLFEDGDALAVFKGRCPELVAKLEVAEPTLKP